LYSSLKATIDALQTNAVPFVVLYSARWPSGEYDAGILTVWPCDGTLAGAESLAQPACIWQQAGYV